MAARVTISRELHILNDTEGHLQTTARPTRSCRPVDPPESTGGVFEGHGCWLSGCAAMSFAGSHLPDNIGVAFCSKFRTAKFFGWERPAS
jgi:hypothetical protein